MSKVYQQQQRTNSNLEKFVIYGYKLLNEIGTGSFCVVYEGTNKDSQPRAIKIIDKQKVQKMNPKVIAMIDEEVKVMNRLSKLNHPNILKYYESFELLQNKYIITELCERETLYDKLLKVPYFSEKDAMIYFCQIKDGILAMHSQKIAHRDLKLPNILFGLDGNIKLADFGFSKELSIDSEFQSVLGTMTTVAPEVLANKGYSLKADIFSMGQILCKMLFGDYLFKIQDFYSNYLYLQQHIDKNLEIKVKEFNVSENIRYLIYRMLRIDPNQRIDILEIAKEFRQGCHQQVEQYIAIRDPSNKVIQKKQQAQQQQMKQLSRVLSQEVILLPQENSQSRIKNKNIDNKESSSGIIKSNPSQQVGEFSFNQSPNQYYQQQQENKSQQKISLSNSQVQTVQISLKSEKENPISNSRQISFSQNILKNQEESSGIGVELQQPINKINVIEKSSAASISSSQNSYQKKFKKIQKANIQELDEAQYELEKQKLQQRNKERQDFVDLYGALQQFLFILQQIKQMQSYKRNQANQDQIDKFLNDFYQNYELYLASKLFFNYSELLKGNHQINKIHKNLVQNPDYKNLYKKIREQYDLLKRYILKQLRVSIENSMNYENKITQNIQSIVSQVNYQFVRLIDSQYDLQSSEIIRTLIYFHLMIKGYQQFLNYRFKMNFEENILKFAQISSPNTQIKRIKELRKIIEEDKNSNAFYTHIYDNETKNFNDDQMQLTSSSQTQQNRMENSNQNYQQTQKTTQISVSQDNRQKVVAQQEMRSQPSITNSDQSKYLNQQQKIAFNNNYSKNQSLQNKY